jgi:hypothetical protein
MTDVVPGGPHRDLWALPSEELPPGAAQFISMARELAQLMSDDTSGEPDAATVVALGRPAGSAVLPPEAEAWIDAEDLPEPQGTPPGDDESSWIPHLGPHLRLVGAPEADRNAADDATGSSDWEGDEPAGEAEEGAAMFLEMVDRAETVRVFPSAGQPEKTALSWLWASGEEGAPAADALLSVVEQAMRHVSQSDDIRNEELRSRLLDLFTDFAARQPWKEAERPGAQRVNRLTGRARDEESGEGSR